MCSPKMLGSSDVRVLIYSISQKNGLQITQILLLFLQLASDRINNKKNVIQDSKILPLSKSRI